MIKKPKQVLRFSAYPSLLFCTLVLATHAFAYDDSKCDSYPNVEVTVTPVFDEASIDSSQSMATIQQMAMGKNVIPHYDMITLGITQYTPVIEFHAPMSLQPMTDGTTCARVEKANATIGYKNVNILLAHELTADQCSIRHVLEHEQKHVTVNRVLLQEYTNKIQIRLQEYLKLYGMFRVPNPDYAKTLLNEKVNAIITDMTTKMLEENRRRQRTIDTPEEYAKNSKECSGHINGIVSKAMGKR